MRRPSRQVAKVAATVAGAVCSTLLFGALHTGAASGLRFLARGPTEAAGNANQLRSAAVWSRTIRAPRVGAGSRKGRHCQTARPGLRLRGDYETRDARRACSPTLGVVSARRRPRCDAQMPGRVVPTRVVRGFHGTARPDLQGGILPAATPMSLPHIRPLGPGYRAARGATTKLSARG
jgi:hypothetical protein